MKIILASNNSGKLKEFQAILANYKVTLVPQAELGIADVPETGLSFVENAIIKARHAAQISGLPVLADDSGLEVAALNGAPGIYSARYAGAAANPSANIQKLLSELAAIPNEKRQATFQCVLVFMRHATDPTPLICQGSWHGEILTAPQGEQGFGYDPIFYVPSAQCSAAQLPAAIKNQISHRGQALKLLLEQLPEKL